MRHAQKESPAPHEEARTRMHVQVRTRMRSAMHAQSHTKICTDARAPRHPRTRNQTQTRRQACALMRGGSLSAWKRKAVLRTPMFDEAGSTTVENAVMLHRSAPVSGIHNQGTRRSPVGIRDTKDKMTPAEWKVWDREHTAHGKKAKAPM